MRVLTISVPAVITINSMMRQYAGQGANWLIGINATRLFCLYGVTLNVGRVMSPTLALLVQRESDIESFISRPFVPEITCGGFTASGEKGNDPRLKNPYGL